MWTVNTFMSPTQTCTVWPENWAYYLHIKAIQKFHLNELVIHNRNHFREKYIVSVTTLPPSHLHLLAFYTVTRTMLGSPSKGCQKQLGKYLEISGWCLGKGDNSAKMWYHRCDASSPEAAISSRRIELYSLETSCSIRRTPGPTCRLARLSWGY